VTIESPVMLIADDDRDMRESLAEYFEESGITVHHVADGKAAVDFAEQNQVHILLFDVHMPRLTGLEALFKIRKTHPDTPCILASAKLDDEIQRLGTEGNAFAILKKPDQLREIRNNVFAALKEHYDWSPS
jgi:DNA-binding response OmpR family regulator